MGNGFLSQPQRCSKEISSVKLSLYLQKKVVKRYKKALTANSGCGKVSLCAIRNSVGR